VEAESALAIETDFGKAAQAASLTLALLFLPALLLSLGLGDARPLAFVGPTGLALLVLRLRGFASAASSLPNLITALRVALTGLMGLGTLGADPLPYALSVLLIFTLDGVDGTLARRLSASSPLGAHFDMESDGYLVLMLTTLLALRGVSLWVLLGGILRYAYVIATALVPSRGEAPPSRFGRYAFSVSLTALTLALCFLPARVPAPFDAAPTLATWLAALGTGVLAWSFARSFYWAFRPPA
jgi:phosphatidylglycerophosphate synthase